MIRAVSSEVMRGRILSIAIEMMTFLGKVWNDLQNDLLEEKKEQFLSTYCRKDKSRNCFIGVNQNPRLLFLGIGVYDAHVMSLHVLYFVITANHSL